MRIPMSKESMTTRFHDAKRLMQDGENLLAKGAQYLAEIREWAQEDGLSRELRELEHPKPFEPAVWEETGRVLVHRAYCIYGPNAYRETELYSAGIGAVVDLPLSIIRRLGDAVEMVAATTELRPIQAPGMTPVGG